MKRILLLCTLLIPFSSYAAVDPKLSAACEAARQKLLTPEREALIRDCVAGGKSQGSCNTFYSTYGDAQGLTGTGNHVPRKYGFLPECVAAEQAVTDHRAAPESKTTTGRDSDPSRTNYR